MRKNFLAPFLNLSLIPYLEIMVTIAFIWRENMLGYLSADIACSEKRTVFRERSSRKTVSFEEQIMSKDKYPSIFSQPNWGYCVYYPSVLKIGEYPRFFSPRDAFRPIARALKYLIDYNGSYNIMAKLIKSFESNCIIQCECSSF